jgi:hypothetical protein
MGFNATRRYRDSKNRDIALLGLAVLLVGGALAWALGLF